MGKALGFLVLQTGHRFRSKHALARVCHVKLINLAFETLVVGGVGAPSGAKRSSMSLRRLRHQYKVLNACRYARVCADRSGSIVSLAVGRDAAVGELK